MLSLSGPCPPPPPLGPFSPSLCRFRKEATSAAPSGTPPPAQIPCAEKKPDPPVRPPRPPRPFVTQEAHLGQTEWAGGFRAHPPPASALPLWPPPLAGQNWCSTLLPCPPQPTGEPSLPPSHFDGVCDISCCEVKEGPLRPAPFSCSLLVRVSVFPLVRLSSKQVMVEVPMLVSSRPSPGPPSTPLAPSLPTAGPRSAVSA